MIILQLACISTGTPALEEWQATVSIVS